MNSQPAQDTHDTVQIAIETTGVTGSLAVLQGETVLRACKLDSGRPTAASLAPVLAQTLQWCGESEKRPELVSIADGPGSFTGLRIGVTTAKTLGYANNWPLVAVDSLAAIAATCFAQHPGIDRLLVGLNAYRGQVFTADFQRSGLLIPLAALRARSTDKRPDSESGQPWSTHPDQVRVVDSRNWQQILDRARPGDFVTGDAKVFAGRGELRFAERPTGDAIGVGLLAARAAILGAWSDPLGLVPRYLRPSAAEEKAEKALGSAKPL